MSWSAVQQTPFPLAPCRIDIGAAAREPPTKWNYKCASSAEKWRRYRGHPGRSTESEASRLGRCTCIVSKYHSLPSLIRGWPPSAVWGEKERHGPVATARLAHLGLSISLELEISSELQEISLELKEISIELKEISAGAVPGRRGALTSPSGSSPGSPPQI